MGPRAAPGADEVLYAPTSKIVAESLADYTPNEPAPAAKRKRRRKKRFFEEEALDLYGGQEGFLVRTAVIRSRDYDPKDAPIIRSPEDIWPIVQHLQFADQEHFVVLCMNARSRLLAIHETAIGGTSGVTVQAKHVVKVPLLVSAAAVIVAHNHPSHSRTLSQEDIDMTRVLKEAFDCIGVTLLDHVVVAREGLGSYIEQVGPP